jgi:hypothetical protein
VKIAPPNGHFCSFFQFDEFFTPPFFDEVCDFFCFKSCVKKQNNNKTKQNLFGILMTSLLPVSAITAATMWTAASPTMWTAAARHFMPFCDWNFDDVVVTGGRQPRRQCGLDNRPNQLIIMKIIKRPRIPRLSNF